MFRRSGPIGFQSGAPNPAATQTGPGSPRWRDQGYTAWSPARETSPWSARGFPDPAEPEALQRGFGTPEAIPVPDPGPPSGPYGKAIFVQTPYYDGGALMFAPKFGKILENPIGAGIQVPFRSYSSYYPSGQYDAGVIFWASEYIPTSIPSSALMTPDELEAILGNLEIYKSIQVAP
jgi:hypothetical protein